MADEREHLQDDVAEKLTALLIDSVIDYAMFVLDPDGRVRSWNPGARRLKGYDPHEIIGQHFSLFYTEEDRAAGMPGRLLGQAASEGSVTHSGWRVRKDGSRFWGDVTITALHDEEGTLSGFAKVTRDRTDQYLAEEAMAQALERERRTAQQLAQLEEDRSQFMAAVSHDLQTPLGAIQGSLAVLDEGDDEQQALVAVIRRNLERLLTMARQLAEASRLERGRVKVAPRPTDLRAAIDECIAAMRPVIDGRDFVVDVDGSAQVDPLAFQRVMTNLLTNAHHHAPPGAPVAISSRDEGDFIQVAVDDEGPGVPAEERQRIFEEFRQGGRRGGDAGLGLGLSIVRHYVEAHGGRAWVEDGTTGGARFVITVPAVPERGEAPGRDV